MLLLLNYEKNIIIIIIITEAHTLPLIVPASTECPSRKRSKLLSPSSATMLFSVLRGGWGMRRGFDGVFDVVSYNFIAE